MVSKKISKGEVVQYPDEQTHKIIQVIAGLLRMYIVDERGKEHIYMFGPEGWTISDFSAITENRPSDFFVDALEDSEIEIFSKGLKEKLPEIFTQSGPKTISLMGRRISTLQHRVVMLLAHSASDRYKHFLTTYPDIVNRVPQKMIASYLGITPQALSKIRSQKPRTGK